MAEPMKIRATLKGDVTDVKVLMTHPMETGQRKDAAGQAIPMHFIQKVVATLNDKVVLDAQWSQAVSKNPFLGFRIKGAKVGDTVSVSWEDNKGEKSSINSTVTAAN